jgi:hypothetical protein
VRARVFADGKIHAKVLEAAAYVKHIQDLIIHGLAAPARTSDANGRRRRGRGR